MADGVIGRLARILHEESGGEVGVDGHRIDNPERIVRLLIAELREPADAMIEATCDGDDSWGSCVTNGNGRRLWRDMIDFILNEPEVQPPTDKYETFRVPVEIWRAMYQGGSWMQRNTRPVEPDCHMGEERLKRLIFVWFLRPLIAVNYWMRGKGWLRDKMFWADAVALGLGYTYEPPWLKRRLLAEGTKRCRT